MGNTKTHDIVVPENQQQGMKFREFYVDINKEINIYKELGELDRLMEQPVKLSLLDANGKVVEGAATLMVGFVEGGAVVITGNIEGVFS